jgi:hypothetical protein
MATKPQILKVAVTTASGRVDRMKSVYAILDNFGPMDDTTLLANVQRADESATIRNVRRILYRLRKAGRASKVDDLWDSA